MDIHSRFPSPDAEPPRPGRVGSASGAARPARGEARRERSLDARTLYLAAAEPLRVSSTGEALVVTHLHSRAAQRVPVARLLRIVCTESTEWSGAALTLCMQRGVPICWLDGRGRSQGQLWPQRPRRTDLAEALLALAADRGDWPESYANWLRHQRMDVLRRWRAERERAGSAVAETEWQCAKRSVIYLDEVPEHLPALLHGMAAALVAARLSECGLQPLDWDSDGEPLTLAADLTRLIWLEMNLCAGPLADAIAQPREAAAIFERWAGSCAGLLHQHLANLRAHALRVLHA